MHDHGVIGEMLQPTDEPAAVDQRRPDALRQLLRRLRVFDDVMVQSHDPAGARILSDGNLGSARACSADTRPSALVNEKCVSALEFSTMIPSPSSVSGGSTMGKIVSPQSRQRSRQACRSIVGEGGHVGGIVPFQRVGQGATDPTVPCCPRHGAACPAACECGDRPDLAQPLRGTRRQVHPGRARAVHHVDVVVARQRDHKFRQSRVGGQCSEELGPLRGAAGIGQVAGYQDHVQRMRCVDLLQPRQRLPQSLVATWTRIVRSRCETRSARRPCGCPTDARCARFGRRPDRRGVGRAGRVAGPWSHRRCPRSARPPQSSRR